MLLQLGGKGANLCEMAKCGVNVPPGLTITTEVCQDFYRVGECPPPPAAADIFAVPLLVRQILGIMDVQTCSVLYHVLWLACWFLGQPLAAAAAARVLLHNIGNTQLLFV